MASTRLRELAPATRGSQDAVSRNHLVFTFQLRTVHMFHNTVLNFKAGFSLGNNPSQNLTEPSQLCFGVMESSSSFRMKRRTQFIFPRPVMVGTWQRL